MKKLVSLVLSLCLLLSLCAFSAAEELPTLEVYMYGDDLPDTQKVSDAISEITAEKIGCRIHLNVVKEFQKNMPLTMASNEQVDLVCDAASWNYWTFAKEGAYLDITDMLQTVTPNLYATLTSNMLEAAKVNGKIYGVPNYKDMSYQGGLWLEKKLADEQNIDLDKVYTLEEIEPWLEALRHQLQLPQDGYEPVFLLRVSGRRLRRRHPPLRARQDREHLCLSGIRRLLQADVQLV